MRPVRRSDFDVQAGPRGAFLVGTPDVVAEKIARHSNALGGLSRVTFQMDAASQRHDRLAKSIELIGTRVLPALASLGLRDKGVEAPHQM